MNDFELGIEIKRFVKAQTGIDMSSQEAYDAVVKMFGYAQALQEVVPKFVPKELKGKT